MAEISGMKCNDCGRRVFVEDDESPFWATSVMTIPASRKQITIHYCPQCTEPYVDKAGEAEEKLNTAQRKVLDPGHVDPKIAAMFEQEPEHVRDSQRSGVPISDWVPNGPPPGDPVWSPADTAPVPLPAHVGPPPPTSPPRGQPVVTDASVNMWPGGNVSPTERTAVVKPRPRKTKVKGRVERAKAAALGRGGAGAVGAMCLVLTFWINR